MYMGLNPGNHYTKGVNGLSKNENAIIPSFVAKGRKRRLDNIKNPLDNLDVRINDEWKFVGKLAKGYADAIAAYDKDKANNEVTKICLITLAAHLAHRAYECISPALCLPIVDYRDQRKEFRRNIEGVYKVKTPNKFVNLEIIDPIIFPEGGAAGWDLFLDENGNVVEGYSSQKIGIIDIGSRTTNVAVMNNMEYQDNLSDTLPLGMWDLYGEALREIKQTHDILIHQVEEYIDTIDITPYYQNLANAISQNIRMGAWKIMPRLDAIILCGGSSIPLHPFMAEKFSNINTELHPNPVLANALGCYKASVARGDEVKRVHRV